MTQSRSRCSGAAILAACTLAGCTPQPRPVPVLMPAPTTTQWSYRQVKGQEIRTEHWVIYTTTTSPNWMDQLPAFVEACYEQYQRLVPAPDSSRSLTLYLFANGAQWDDFAVTRSVLGTNIDVQAQLGGFTQRDISAVYVTAEPVDVLRSIAHQGMHQYLWQHCPAEPPPWVGESLATLAEGFSQRGQRFVFESRYNAGRFEQARRAIQKKWWLDLHDLLTLEGLGKIPGPHAAARTYLAQLWTLATFLQNDSRYGKGFEQMRLGLSSDAFKLKLQGYMTAGPEGITAGEAAFRLYVTEDPLLFQQRYYDKTMRYLNMAGD
jgi:hypothetical protein